MIVEKKNKYQHLSVLYRVSFSGLASVAEPLPKCYSTRAHYYAHRPPDAPPGRRKVKENELEDEGQYHIQSPHQGHGPSLLSLQGLCEEGLTSNTQDSNQHQHPAITATEWDLPFPKDGYSDEALDEANDSVVPN